MPGMGLCTLKLKDGTRSEDIHFGELGYAREARTSYRTSSLRDSAVCCRRPRASRFLCRPLMPSLVRSSCPRQFRASCRRIGRDGARSGRICAAIPHRDLALQWDVCIEMIQWDGRVPNMPPPPQMEQIFAGAFARLTAPVPPGVELGFHLCYGDMDAEHFVEPTDLAKAVELANLIIASSKMR